MTVHNYDENNTSLPPTKKFSPQNVFMQDVVDYIESEKLCKPIIYTSEIQQCLLLNGVYHFIVYLPKVESKSAFMMTVIWQRKKYCNWRQSLNQNKISAVNTIISLIEFRNQTVSRVALHFCDESGVVIQFITEWQNKKKLEPMKKQHVTCSPVAFGLPTTSSWIEWCMCCQAAQCYSKWWHSLSVVFA